MANVNVVCAKGVCDDVACKRVFIAAAPAKYFFGKKYNNVGFPFGIMLES